jgi:hypothetical protein
LNILEYDQLCRVNETLGRMEANGGMGAPSMPTVPLQIYNDVVNMHNDLVRKLDDANAEIEALTEKRDELRALIAEWKQRDLEWKECADVRKKRSDFFERKFAAAKVEIQRLEGLLRRPIAPTSSR